MLNKMARRKPHDDGAEIQERDETALDGGRQRVRERILVALVAMPALYHLHR